MGSLCAGCSRASCSFYRDYPHLRLRILADNRISSLAAGDADIALRFLRPTRGELVGRRLHSETYGLFASPSLLSIARWPGWVWRARCRTCPSSASPRRRSPTVPARLLVEDRKLWPLRRNKAWAWRSCRTASPPAWRDCARSCHSRSGALDRGPIPARDLWMVVHRKRQRLPKVRAVMTWLGALPAFNRQGPRGAT